MDPESLRDAPLFREMQRVMSSSSGPVNWELARQVAVAGAAEAGEDREATEADRHGFEEAVRVAELHVARFTGLEPPTDVAEVRPVRRAEWIGANTESLAGLLEPAASAHRRCDEPRRPRRCRRRCRRWAACSRSSRRC